jgi:5'-3' exonuclease
VKVHLVDGTYELFRHHYGQPKDTDTQTLRIGATRGVLRSVLDMLERGATHLGVATDHVIESFRNEMWLGYKTSEGMEPLLLAQFPLLEEALDALGVTVWAMVELEADDALAAAARAAATDERVEQVIICTPDKDLAQCVVDARVIQLDRRTGKVFEHAGVVEKFGVPPASIPDWLALVGDSADGFPGLPGFGAKTAAAVLARYQRLEAIPPDAADWDVPAIRGVPRLAATLAECREAAFLFRDLATLRADADIGVTVDGLEWHGPRPGLAEIAEAVRAPDVAARAASLASARARS